MTSVPRHDTPAPAAHPDAELGFELAKPARVSFGRVLAIGGALVAVLGGTFILTYLPRHAAQAKLADEAGERAHALPRLAVVSPRLIANERTLSLPGSVQPLEEAVIYARASGYVRVWHVDMGAHVEAGALLAEIDTPELDQELAQARAALAQAKASVLQAEANRGLAASRLERTGRLVEAGLSPQQDLDQTQAQSAVGDADFKVAQANVAAQEANIRRISDLKAFSRVTAPFAGTITERSVDRGSLVAAGNVASPLFKLSSVGTVRVLVQVPQDAAPAVVLNAPAVLHVREFPSQRFEGVIARTSGALDPATRTLSTEVRVPNPDGRLLGGMYADVELKLPAGRRVFELPATALLNDAAGLRLAVVDQSDTLHLMRVQLDRDLGATIRIATGLDGSERVVQVAGAELADGQRVTPVVVPVPSAAANAPALAVPAPSAAAPSAAPSAAAPSAARAP